jgi:hypothetical protein
MFRKAYPQGSSLNQMEMKIGTTRVFSSFGGEE